MAKYRPVTIRSSPGEDGEEQAEADHRDDGQEQGVVDPDGAGLGRRSDRGPAGSPAGGDGKQGDEGDGRDREHRQQDQSHRSGLGEGVHRRRRPRPGEEGAQQ